MKKNYCFFSLFIISSVLFAQHTKFVLWGDSQFQNPEVFEEFVQKTTLINPDFVVHVGDMIHGYTYNINSARKQWERFKKQIAPLKAPFYPTPGNHDVTTKEIVEAYAEAWNNTDKFYYSFTKNNCTFIILNAFENQDFYKISDEQFEWMKNVLEANKDNNIFISLHPPLHLEKDNKEWERIHNILKHYRTRAVFTGHYHIYDYRKIDGIDYFCLNTSGNMSLNTGFLGGNSHQILSVEVNNDSLSYLIYTQDDIYAHDAVDINERAHSRKYFEHEKTVRLKTTNQKIDTTVSIEIKNSSNENRFYKLTWSIQNNSWNIYPYYSEVEIPADSQIFFQYKIEASNPEFSRNELPYLNVESDYKTVKGYNNISKQKISLFVPPQIYASQIHNEIIIDGSLSEDSWNSEEKITNLYSDFNFTKAPEKTEITILYDEKYLYAGIKGAEPNPEGLSAIAYSELPLVFGDDDFEIFFDTNLDFKTFFRLMVNPAETILSSGPEGRYTFTFDVAAYIGNDFWSAEFKIPFEQFKITKPNAGDVWGFNVRRHRQQADAVQSDWSKMNEHPPYQPEYFGLLEFK